MNMVVAIGTQRLNVRIILRDPWSSLEPPLQSKRSFKRGDRQFWLAASFSFSSTTASRLLLFMDGGKRSSESNLRQRKMNWGTAMNPKRSPTFAKSNGTGRLSAAHISLIFLYLCGDVSS